LSVQSFPLTSAPFHQGIGQILSSAQKTKDEKHKKKANSVITVGLLWADPLNK